MSDRKRVWFVVGTVDGIELDWWGPFLTEKEAKDNAGSNTQKRIVSFVAEWLAA